MAVAAAAATGLIAATAYVRVQGLRTFVSVLSVVLVVFPGFFLFGSPVRDIVFPNEPENVAHQVTAESPIVMVVFDE